MILSIFTSLVYLQFMSCKNFINGTYNEQINPQLQYVPILNKTNVNEQHHPCYRKCDLNEKPMTCIYNFDIEWYSTMSKACYKCPKVMEDCFRKDCVVGNGHQRTVMVVNRKLPGPSVEVCLGDKVIVKVNNKLLGETTSIHWHGHHQKLTPYMDGAPFISQCPILPSNSFLYEFTAENSGTHFWHSHTNMQRGDGVFGKYIVRAPDELNQHASLYDEDLSEHSMIFTDWDIDITIKKYMEHYHVNGTNKPSTIIINGLGLESFDQALTPLARFIVKKGLRYRFRLINAGFLNCPIEMSIVGHTMTVIATDGMDIQPIEVNSLVSYAGERFDFVLNANQKESIYWIKLRGLMDCDDRFTSAHQVAVLVYNETSKFDLPEARIPNYSESHEEGLQLNALNVGTNENSSVAIPELQSLAEWDSSLNEIPDYQFYIVYDFYNVDHPDFHKFPFYGYHNVSESTQRATPQLNYISFTSPHFPVLPGKHSLTDDMFCNETSLNEKGKDCQNEMCACTQLIRVPLNAIVEVILVDQGVRYDANHPFHLHGHSFRVVAMERLGSTVTVDEIKELDKNGSLKRNLVDAPIKDTVTVPDGGYTIIRFNSSNPGYWLFHCHLEFHVEVGMALLFKFGENSDMPDPPEGFPVCGHYSHHGYHNGGGSYPGESLHNGVSILDRTSIMILIPLLVVLNLLRT